MGFSKCSVCTRAICCLLTISVISSSTTLNEVDSANLLPDERFQSGKANHVWLKVNPNRKGGPDGIHTHLKFQDGKADKKYTLLQQWAKDFLSGTIPSGADPEKATKLRAWAEDLIETEEAGWSAIRKRKADDLQDEDDLDAAAEHEGPGLAHITEGHAEGE